MFRKLIAGCIAVWCVTALATASAQTGENAPQELRAMSWNIWHGGKQDGDEAGPRRVVEVIRDSGADIVAMQETYGSGERIAMALGFHFQPRGTNVSILSRYPVVEDISVFEEFKCVGAIVELPGNRRIAFYSIWLPYNAEIWEAGTRDTSNPQSMLDACKSSATDLEKIHSAINGRLAGPQYKDIPIVIAGDFNSMSHLDWSAVNPDQFGAVIDWPTSHVLVDAGFRDSFREVNPFVDRVGDRTWTPRFPEQEQDRIDYVYYRSNSWQATESRVIASQAEKFPSDHAALLTVFQETASPPAETGLRVVSYNIKHGRGMDDVVDLNRTAEVLKKLQPDFVGLQEVDNRVTRSGTINEPAELGRQLGLHAAFGSFMDLQGGQYGLAVLSRYPIRRIHHFSLPKGNEPRMALGVEVRMPGGDPMMLVNLHFDWVGDDTFRFDQASRLDGFLKELKMPYILLGDFNDRPGSRTLDLLSQNRLEAKKPADDRFTFSSTEPDREIDFIFAAPAESWKIQSTQVIDEPVASDHRPVLAELTFQSKTENKK